MKEITKFWRKQGGKTTGMYSYCLTLSRSIQGAKNDSNTGLIVRKSWLWNWPSFYDPWGPKILPLVYFYESQKINEGTHKLIPANRRDFGRFLSFGRLWRSDFRARPKKCSPLIGREAILFSEVWRQAFEGFWAITGLYLVWKIRNRELDLQKQFANASERPPCSFAKLKKASKLCILSAWHLRHPKLSWDIPMLVGESTTVL